LKEKFHNYIKNIKKIHKTDKIKEDIVILSERFHN